jgi:hypothetical protein
MKHYSAIDGSRIIILIVTLILGIISMSRAAETTCKCGIEGAEYRVWYLDSDGDGLGDAFNARIDCNQPVRYVANSLDLDDTNNDLFSGQENSILREWYLDEDGDGFGDPFQVIISKSCPKGYVADATDMDDLDETIWFDENAQGLLSQNKEH